MKISKYIVITASICAIFLTGCGSEQAQTKNQTTPQAAPAKQVQVQQPQQDKVISQGKIVGTTQLTDGKTVQVEERIIETTNAFGEKVQRKRYYDAANGHAITYTPKKDVTIKNKGQQVDDVKVK